LTRVFIAFGAIGLIAVVGTLVFIGAVWVASVINSDSTLLIGDARMMVVAGLVALIFMIAIAQLMWLHRQKIFFKYAALTAIVPIALFGTSIVLNGLVVIDYRVAQTEEAKTQIICTTPEQQYSKAQSAIVPIVSEKGSGTGFFVDDKGTLLTAYHVIEGVDEVYANDKNDLELMRVLKTSPEFDLALLRLDRDTPSFFSLSNDYKVTDSVIAFGYPGNAIENGAPSLTRGIVSRIVTSSQIRQLDETLAGLEVIQTDAAINPGNSGGPLISNCGVVGVIWSLSDTAQLNEELGIVSEQGIGYAVSAKTAARVFGLPINSGD